MALGNLNIALILKLVDKVSAPAKKAASALKRVEDAQRNLGAGAQKVLGATKTGAAGLLAYSGAASALALQLLKPARQFEQFQTILKTTEGSAEGAKKAMDWVEEFAVKTPYELDQVMDAFVKLRSYGLDPTNGMLKSLGDTSAAMGKPIMQAVEAIADAVTGENERLKEFGIKASKTGKMISYEYPG